MEFITLISAIIAVIVALISIPKSLHAIGDLKRKKFKEELETYKDYFKNYHFDNNQHSKLLKDKVAQNLTRSKDINYDLLKYFINLHEENKANFDKLVEHYDWGNRFIISTKIENNFQFRTKSYVSQLTININYLLYAFMVIFSLLIFINQFSLSVSSLFNNVVAVSSIILSIGFLRKAEDMREALKFLKIIRTNMSDNID